MDIKQQNYDILHQGLAKQYKTTESVIAFTRGVAGEKFLRRTELLDLVIDKLKIPNLGSVRLQKYRDRLNFLGRISDYEFEKILVAKPEDQNGSEETEPNVATSINDQ